MAFDSERFFQADFKPRQGRVELPTLAAFFDGDPVAIVRQLSGYELARCQEAVNMNRSVAELVSGLIGEDHREKVVSIRRALGVSDSVPDEIAKRIEMLTIASVEPRFDREACVRLCTHYPVEFYCLTNEITRLTGEGASLGESIGSGSAEISAPL